jgi:3D (Asp-Asp-Asp) domain-containing protein
MNGDDITATREKVLIGGVASSNLAIAPYGSKWLVEKIGVVGVVIVNDCMGSFTENLRLDIFCGEGDDGLDAALNVGRGRYQTRRVRQK